jgi:hypothetical protein
MVQKRNASGSDNSCKVKNENMNANVVEYTWMPVASK